MSTYLSLNGRMHKADQPLILPDNRSFRYGDGFFETMKLVDGSLPLGDLHFERLFHSLDQMGFERPAHFHRTYIEEQIRAVTEKNQHTRLARIRLTVFRGEGGLYDPVSDFPNHLVQSWQLNPAAQELNENGLVLGIYQQARKSSDDFSHIKSNNYQPYLMAARYAKKMQWNEAIVLNHADRVADATIANVFIGVNGIIKTPALSEGPVAGVMRQYLLREARKAGYAIEEGPIHPDELRDATDMFLTNAISGIRWVKQCGENGYVKELSISLYQSFVKVLWEQ
jgi:branched-chain amino acid aminotransferase